MTIVWIRSELNNETWHCPIPLMLSLGYELRRDSGQYDGGVSVREVMDTSNEAREVSHILTFLQLPPCPIYA